MGPSFVVLPHSGGLWQHCFICCRLTVACKNRALQHIVGNNQLAFSHDLVQVLSTAKDNYDDGSFEVAAVSLTNAIEFSISRVDSTADLQSKERVALGACFALRGQ